MKYIRTSVELTRENFIFYRKLAYGDKKRLLNATLKSIRQIAKNDYSIVGKIIGGIYGIERVVDNESSSD